MRQLGAIRCILDVEQPKDVNRVTNLTGVTFALNAWDRPRLIQVGIDDTARLEVHTVLRRDAADAREHRAADEPHIFAREVMFWASKGLSTSATDLCVDSLLEG